MEAASPTPFTAAFNADFIATFNAFFYCFCCSFFDFFTDGLLMPLLFLLPFLLLLLRLLFLFPLLNLHNSLDLSSQRLLRLYIVFTKTSQINPGCPPEQTPPALVQLPQSPSSVPCPYFSHNQQFPCKLDT